MKNLNKTSGALPNLYSMQGLLKPWFKIIRGSIKTSPEIYINTYYNLFYG